jgi:hypothetical protein
MLEMVGDLEDQAQMVMHPIPVANRKVVSIIFQNSETYVFWHVPLTVLKTSVPDLRLSYLFVSFMVYSVLHAFRFVNVAKFNLIDLYDLWYIFHISD